MTPQTGYGYLPYNSGYHATEETRAFPFYGGFGFPGYGFGFPGYGFGYGFPGYGFYGYRPWFRPFGFWY